MKKLSSVFALLFFLATLSSLLSTSFSYGDEITIRTIITPIGSQCEKWGAAGLMVCIGRKPIPEGGCGQTVTEGWKINNDFAGTKEKIDINYNDIVIFKDTSDGHGGDPNHQFDFKDGWPSDSDTIYEVRGSGGGEGILSCTEKYSGSCTGVTATGDEVCAFYDAGVCVSTNVFGSFACTLSTCNFYARCCKIEY